MRQNKRKKLNEERRRLWLANINRQDASSTSSKISSDHFVNGKPTSLYDRTNLDWAPTLKLIDLLTPSKSAKKMEQTETEIKRYQRCDMREKRKEQHSVARLLLELSNDVRPDFVATPIYFEDESAVEATNGCQCMLMSKLEEAEGSEYVYDPISNSQNDSEIQRLITENMFLKKQIDDLKLSGL